LAGCLLYIPFVKILDKGKLKTEAEAAQAEGHPQTESIDATGETV
jgi:PTS system cellobiose-specific IIC component